MIMEGFHRSKFDSCVYFKKTIDGSFICLLIYVDDMLIICKNMVDINQLKEAFKSEFEMKDLRAAKRILGIDILRDKKKDTLSLTQIGYVQIVLKEFGMLNAKVVFAKVVSTPIPSHYKLKSAKGTLTEYELKYMIRVPYSNAVGYMMYAMIATRPDIAYGVCLVSRFMSCPSKDHWHVVKWLLRYLNGSSRLELIYRRTKLNQIDEIKGYFDADYASDLDRRRSLIGYAFTL